MEIKQFVGQHVGTTIVLTFDFFFANTTDH